MDRKIKENFRAEIQTERLVLRPWETSFAQQMFDNWATDKDVTKFLSWDPHKNVEETKQVIAMWTQELNYNWCIFDKSANEAVGSISVVKRADRDFYCEVGYCSSKKVWNKGYMTEALKGVINFLFDEGYNKIELRHAVDNPASGRVMQKAGMTYQGISPCSSYLRGVFHDCKMYYILNPKVKINRVEE